MYCRSIGSYFLAVSVTNPTVLDGLVTKRAVEMTGYWAKVCFGVFMG